MKNQQRQEGQFSVSLYTYILCISYINWSNNIHNYNNLPDINNSLLQLITQLKGYFDLNPVIALSLAITLFSFLGIPPFVGFFAKHNRQHVFF